jgi:RecA/RadA recombinase
MKRTRTRKPSMGEQIENHANGKDTPKKEYDGNMETMISTGSTLLDLAVSGGRKRGGGLPGGIMVVAYGPSGSGKTVLACEVAGCIQRQGGKINYKDSEARLDEKFSQIFDLQYKKINYSKPDTVPEAFLPLSKWKVDTGVVNGYIVDSLAALSTTMEMEDDSGDKMGMRRAKEFSEHLRKGARIVTNNNLLLFCTNQIREKADAQKFERKDINPGGKAIEFYSSLILRFSTFQKITKEITFEGKVVKRAIGIEATVEVVKSSIWKPYHDAKVIIYFDYGIDDIRANLQYIKDYSSNKIYTINGEALNVSLDKSVKMIEADVREQELKNQVINLWESIEAKFNLNRKKKVR